MRTRGRFLVTRGTLDGLYQGVPEVFGSEIRGISTMQNVATSKSGRKEVALGHF